MLKLSTFFAEDDHGLNVVPLGRADSRFEKLAAPSLLPEVTRYIEGLRPVKNSQYVLVNALGASEYFSSNVNADAFEEASLIHKPDNWTGNPLLDKVLAKDWQYGFPTFYNAHAFAHHRNKNPDTAYGDVELAAWNNAMKRVELVVRVDRDKCERFGGVAVWDKLAAGNYPDVSMGSRVPWDLCSICADWKTYKEALATFDSAKHKSPGQAVLEAHKRKPIRGISITRNDYCSEMQRMANRILPDGRKVFVFNPFPRFFDISFVFIGADRTAKVMVFVVRAGQTFGTSSALAAEKAGLREPLGHDEKAASIDDERLLRAFKSAALKQSEIDKDTPPNLPPGKAVPALSLCEKDLPIEATNAMNAVPLLRALTTLAGLGIVLKPHEFQATVENRKDIRGKLEKGDITFEELAGGHMAPESFSVPLARALLPSMQDRSALGPIIEKRTIILLARPRSEKLASSHPFEPLRKMGTAYSDYRREVINVIAHTQTLLEKTASSKDADLLALSKASAESLFTPTTFHYLTHAFGCDTNDVEKNANVQGVMLPRNTATAQTHTENPQ